MCGADCVCGPAYCVFVWLMVQTYANASHPCRAKLVSAWINLGCTAVLTVHYLKVSSSNRSLIKPLARIVGKPRESERSGFPSAKSHGAERFFVHVTERFFSGKISRSGAGRLTTTLRSKKTLRIRPCKKEQGHRTLDRYYSPSDPTAVLYDAFRRLRGSAGLKNNSLLLTLFSCLATRVRVGVTQDSLRTAHTLVPLFLCSHRPGCHRACHSSYPYNPPPIYPAPSSVFPASSVLHSVVAICPSRRLLYPFTPATPARH